LAYINSRRNEALASIKEQVYVMLTVEKYGGSSVATVEKIKLISSHIRDRVMEGDRLVVVTSAMGKTTNQLIEFARAIDPCAKGRDLDALIMTGEEQAAALLSLALNYIGINAICLNAYQAEICATSDYQNGLITSIGTDIIRKHLDEGKVVVITGFQGIGEQNDIITLGRGGSDTTAVGLAAALNCPCEIYTDVDGVYTVDPRLYDRPKRLEEITYNDMIELASTGSGVIVTRAVLLAKCYQVPVLVAQSLKEGGTRIVKESFLEKREVTGISIKNNIISVRLSVANLDEKSAGMVFETISRNGLDVEMVYQDLERKFIAFLVKRADEPKLDQVTSDLRKMAELRDVNLCKEFDYDKIALVGIGMNQFPSVISRIYLALSRQGIMVRQMTTNELTASILLSKKDFQKAIDVLAREFGLSMDK
jgi:aspartate kinase